MTLPISLPQRHATGSTRSRRARCTEAKHAAAATELRRAAARAQTVLATETTPAAPELPARAAEPDAGRTRERATAASAARSARVADAVVAQWLLEQRPHRGARRVATA